MLSSLLLVLAAVQIGTDGAPPPAPLWTNPLDRELVVFDGRELLLELRIGATEVVQVDEETKRPLLDSNGKPVTLPTLQYRVSVIPKDAKPEETGVFVGGVDLIRIHLRLGPKVLHTGALAWDPASKQLVLIGSLSTDNTAHVQLHRGPLALDADSKLVWRPAYIERGFEQFGGRGIVGVHPVEKIDARATQSTIDFALLRRGIDGPPTRVRFELATKQWSVDGRPRR
jgi:hypothetical protein